MRLERDSRGQPERSMGDSILPAEPPEWRSIQQQSLDLLQRSKDLRITHFLLQSSLALEGLPGMARVLTLISELLKQYWAELHPRLDAEDDNDPTVRINALAGLTSDITIRLLRESILARSRTFGAVSLRAAANASGLQSFPDENLGAEQLAGALLDSDPEQLEITRAALLEARSAAEAIEQQVSDQVGSAQGVDLGPLKQPLKMALQILGQFAPQSGDSALSDPVSDDSAAPTEYASAPSTPRNTSTSTVSGEINNRDDVLRSLDRILAYYTRHEPSSPLPVLLNRAKNLVHADFAAIVRNLIPDGMSQFEKPARPRQRIKKANGSRSHVTGTPDDANTVAQATRSSNVAKQSSQKFIARNRAPRVQIEYDVELYGAEKKVQLPFVMGVMADLAGKPAEPLAAVADRKFLEIDVDNFDSRLKAMQPRVAFHVPNELTGEGNLSLDLTFESMDDFSPAAVARKVDSLNKLLEARTQLANLLTYMDGKTGAEEIIMKAIKDPALLQALASAPKPAQDQ
nr:hypothetical protein GCM10020185_34900 [Pseudomonas brassicacearum subsp. brassicacearum]